MLALLAGDGRHRGLLRGGLLLLLLRQLLDDATGLVLRRHVLDGAAVEAGRLGDGQVGGQVGLADALGEAGVADRVEERGHRLNLVLRGHNEHGAGRVGGLGRGDVHR